MKEDDKQLHYLVRLYDNIDRKYENKFYLIQAVFFKIKLLKLVW